MASEVKVERCDGIVAPKRWKVTFEGKQAGYVEEVIISAIFGKPEYIGLYFCDGPGVKLVQRAFEGWAGQQQAVTAVIDAWKADRAEQAKKESDSFIGWETV